MFLEGLEGLEGLFFNLFLRESTCARARGKGGQSEGEKTKLTLH